MINKTRGSDPQPFAGLTPEVVLDAAAAFGLAPDGRLFALNSYENRVYQLGAGDTQLVLKFYRPQRWSDAQIAEEHRFTAELAMAELAVAAPLVIAGETLFRYRDFRFAAFPWMRGRAPELDAPEARQILGRSLARIHQIGALRAFQVRPRIGVQRLGWDARGQVLASALLPEALRERYSTVSGALLERVSEAFAAAAGTGEIRLHGDCHLGNLLWNEHGPVFVDLDDCATGVRVQDLWMMLAGPPAEQQRQWGELLRSEEHTSELQSPCNLVCRLLLEKKKNDPILPPLLASFDVVLAFELLRIPERIPTSSTAFALHAFLPCFVPCVVIQHVVVSVPQ